MELIVVPWASGPLLRIPVGRMGDELRRRRGVPIDPSDPDVRALLDAYDAFWADPPLDTAVCAAAHSAVLQVATLLRCGPPSGPVEREYVRRQTRMIGDLPDGDSDPIGHLTYLRATFNRR